MRKRTCTTMYIQEAFMYPMYSDDNKNGCQEVTLYIYQLRFVEPIAELPYFLLYFPKNHKAFCCI